MIISKYYRFLCLLLLILSSNVRADVLVLVHGWASDPDVWLRSGIVQTLHAYGWNDGGVVTATPEGGVVYIPASRTDANKTIYRLRLPAEAPLQIQAAHLYSELLFIANRHKDENLILAGHSAGGVVARMVVVNPSSPAVSALITIATPNLGTGRALQGLEVIHDKPFFCPGPGVAFLKDIAGGDDFEYLKHSQGALVGLVPAAPGTLIDWLNHQKHPDIAYHSIVRQAGDELVPAFSQDLNQVPQLGGKAKVYLTSAGHSLIPEDGKLLGVILATL